MILKSVFIFILFFFLHLSTSAEIVIEYKITPTEENPFLDRLQTLPYKMIMTIGEKESRVEYHRYLSFGEQFLIFPHNEDYYYSCVYGFGRKDKFKHDRIMYDSLIDTNEMYQVLGSKCKKLIGKRDKNEIEIYVTEQYGIGFHPYANISGIPLLFVEKSEVFGSVVYEATSLKIQDVEEDFFDISDFQVREKTEPRENPLLYHELAVVKVRDLSNEKVVLDFNNGKINVINFWFRGCKPCIQEMPLLNKLVDSLQSDRVNFIAISKDPVNVAKKFLEKTAFNYEHYASGGYAVSKYNITSYPTHIITDEEGTVKYVASGFGPYSVFNMAYTIDKLLKE